MDHKISTNKHQERTELSSLTLALETSKPKITINKIHVKYIKTRLYIHIQCNAYHKIIKEKNIPRLKVGKYSSCHNMC